MRMLRKALEDAATDIVDDKKTIVIKGPLSEVYTQALNAVYAKDPETEAEYTTVGLENYRNKKHKLRSGNGILKNTIISLETQQMDGAIIDRIMHSLSGGGIAPTNNFTTIYGVSKDTITEDDVVDISNELAKSPENDRVFIVIDGTARGDNGTGGDVPVERIAELNTAIECLVGCYGGEVYHNLRDALKNV